MARESSAVLNALESDPFKIYCYKIVPCAKKVGSSVWLNGGCAVPKVCCGAVDHQPVLQYLVCWHAVVA